MAGRWTSERFPQFEAAIRGLTEQHRELEDEPLHLALAYDPRRDGQDVFLLEVIGGLSDEARSERDLFEVVFESSAGLPLPGDQRLHLILTTPKEWERAVEGGWPAAREIVGAVRRNDFRVMHSDTVGDRLLRKLTPAERRTRGTTRG